MMSDNATHDLTPDCLTRLAGAVGIVIDPERLPAVLAVLNELFELEREVEEIAAALPGVADIGTGGQS
jgi:ribosomal protein L12E/L44/L45/RPP1/RPP2